MLSALLAAAFTFTAADADIAYKTAESLVRDCTPRDSGTPQSRCAAYLVKDAASAAGLDVVIDTFEGDTPLGSRRFSNVEGVYVSDPSHPWVVFVSHFDTKTGVDCPGANDGASTTGLLAALANMVCTARPRSVNVMFLWTDGEECMERYCARDGLWGSKRAVESIAARKLKVKAVICLDMIGDRDLKIGIPKNTSSALRGMATRVAKAAGFSGVVCEMDELVKDDHVPFLEAGYPSLLLIDFCYGGKPGSNEYWHTSEDTMDKVSKKSLAVSGRYAAALLEELSR
jgi:Zn-dependent M28 family amino/carboxypeptidase